MPAPEHRGVAVIVLAAGNGRRMAAPVNKVFLLVGGKPILARTLERFDRMAIVDRIVLVAAPVDKAHCEAIVRASGVRKVGEIVTGGATRHESEFYGLLAIEDEIESGSIQTVLIHDAVRPFVDSHEVESLVAEARACGGAIPALPAGDRIVAVDPDGTVRRESDDLWLVQTPQAFDAKSVLAAHRRAAEEGFVATDTAAVVERAGQEVSVVLGRPENIKITTSDDLLIAELIAEHAEHVAGPAHP